MLSVKSTRWSALYLKTTERVRAESKVYSTARSTQRTVCFTNQRNMSSAAAKKNAKRHAAKRANAASVETAVVLSPPSAPLALQSEPPATRRTPRPIRPIRLNSPDPRKLWASQVIFKHIVWFHHTMDRPLQSPYKTKLLNNHCARAITTSRLRTSRRTFSTELVD